MTAPVAPNAIDAIVLDIEGTTTPIVFVTGVLVPYARRHLRQHLIDAHGDALRQIGRALREEWMDDVARGEAPPAWTEGSDAGLAAYAEWLMDRDRKSTPLKELQGHIWEEGYRSGTLRGEVYPDVVPALRRWRGAGIPVSIYSSGSAHAQRLLFAHASDGDLTPYFHAFFDTTVGPKTASDSYRRIATTLGCPTGRLLFVSDAAVEIDAATAADCQVLQCVRDEKPARVPTVPVRTIRTFDEIVVR